MPQMPPSPRHREVEDRFRRLISDAELAQPDSVEYEPEAVTFLWHDEKLAVVVDFDDLEAVECDFGGRTGR